MPTLRLSPSDRTLFTAIARAAVVNPFGPEREALDRRIAGSDGKRSALFEQVAVRVAAEIERLRRAHKVAYRDYVAGDGELVRNACLFAVYHRFRAPFDAFIQRQINDGDAAIAAPFARELLTDLDALGFGTDEALRFLAIFYQMRRAFHFIETELVGDSPAMQGLRQRLWDNIFTSDIGRYETRLWNRMEDFSTLLLGETGTGKGAAAAAIGRSGYIPFDEKKGCFSESFTRNFISLNLSQYPETLIESELFGHKKGAFTGAIGDHQGVFARCTPHGSIFLDEIGDLAIPVQIKLLQILQERSFTPVGSHERQRFHGRVIAATHKPLDAMRQSGQFRDDFYYRLCSDVIPLPALRQRLQEAPGELAGLVDAILRRILGSDDRALAAFVLATLQRDLPTDYPWPGNVRELEQAVRRILVTGSYRPPAPPLASADPWLAATVAGSLTAQQLLSGYCQLLYRQYRSYEEVARRADLDRRTVKKHLES